jgi:hypothetical protein
MYHIGLPNPVNLVKSIPHRLGIGGGQQPMPNAADNVATRRLITMLSLGAVNETHPQQGKEYWRDVLKELNPSSPTGLIALASVIFGPRIDGEAAGAGEGLGPINPQTGERVPPVRVNPRSTRTGNPHRDMHVDHAGALIRALMLHREAAQPTAANFAQRVQERTLNPNLMESAHHYAETNEFLHSGKRGDGPSMALSSPIQRALLMKLLAGRRI